MVFFTSELAVAQGKEVEEQAVLTCLALPAHETTVQEVVSEN